MIILESTLMKDRSAYLDSCKNFWDNYGKLNYVCIDFLLCTKKYLTYNFIICSSIFVKV